MFEIVKAGGPMMGPIILASIIAAAIVLERLWTLQTKRVLPAELTDKVWRWVEQGQIQDKHIAALEQNSPLGKVLAAGLANRHRDRAILKEAIEDTGRHVVHELERFIGTLGMIASLSPLMGLLGTVMGMIRTFNAIASAGIGNPTALAGGIAEALITTASGLAVAIPATISRSRPTASGRTTGDSTPAGTSAMPGRSPRGCWIVARCSALPSRSTWRARWSAPSSPAHCRAPPDTTPSCVTRAPVERGCPTTWSSPTGNRPAASSRSPWVPRSWRTRRSR
jgi:biopolymer transport protein ExbB